MQKGGIMPRTRATAKAAGATFERLIADYLRDQIDDRIDRRVKTGAKDKGDIAGLRAHGQRVVIEAKDCAHPSGKFGGWITEAETERGNDDAVAAAVAFKRVGKGKAADQLILMTLADFAAIVTGIRPTQS